MKKGIIIILGLLLLFSSIQVNSGKIDNVIELSETTVSTSGVYTVQKVTGSFDYTISMSVPDPFYVDEEYAIGGTFAFGQGTSTGSDWSIHTIVFHSGIFPTADVNFDQDYNYSTLYSESELSWIATNGGGSGTISISNSALSLSEGDAQTTYLGFQMFVRLDTTAGYEDIYFKESVELPIIYPDLSDPLINSPVDFTYITGTTGNVIIWTVSDSTPYWCNITRDGILVWDSVWDGSEISLNVDSLAIGTYVYICTIYDDWGLSASDEVVLSVVDQPVPEIDSPNDINYFEGNTSVTLTWQPTSDYPSTYEVKRNEVVISSGEWDGSDIEINVGSLAVGTYTYVCTVINTFGESTYDIVTVTIQEEGTVDSVLSISSIMLLSVSILVIIGRKRRNAH